MKKSYKQIESYIINAISNDGYSDKDLETDQEKLQFLKDCFYSEYNWQRERLGNLKALTEWLQGLPSSCNIAFYNHEILELAKKWGSLPQDATEKQEDELLANYWRFMAMRILSLWLKHNIDISVNVNDIKDRA